MKKFVLTVLVLMLFFLAACSDGKKTDEIPDGDAPDSGEVSDGDDVPDTVPDECAGDDCGDAHDSDEISDGDDIPDTVPDECAGDDCGDTLPDDVEDKPETEQCRNLPALSSGVCEVKSGSGAKLVKGNILSGNKTYIGGEVLIDEDGFIVCAGCDCSAEASGATEITCPGATVTPALINGHDHLGYVNNKPSDWKDERFDHRHEWRRGKNGHTNLQKNIASGASPVQKQWAELRQLMSGTLAIAGSGGANGFLRNIDQNFVNTQGLGGINVHYQTFPLGDSSGTMVESGCDKYKMDTANVLQNDCYLPHVSEGINKAARNEMLCVTGRQDGGIDLAKENSAFVHSVGIIAEDGKDLAESRTAIIWSARTNISLYGNTAPVTMLKNQGVLIGLGTDWLSSGSMHILRELACVDYLNKNHFNNTFTDYEIWKLATVNNAAALRILDVTGAIRPGLVGDIVVFDAKDAANPYRAVIAGHEKNVALVLRGGKVFYGDESVVAALDKDNECEKLSVCDVNKKVCVKETGKTLAELQSANSDQYKLFYCGTPEDEPTCVPQRTRSADESRPYSGPKEGDKDGDGIADEDDNCPDIFNPIRPVDNGRQADSDGDGVGDVCDPCPLDKNSSGCKTVNASDKDGDGIINAFDNCPFDKNPDQKDADGNGIGDVCDTMKATIYEIKQKTVAEGALVKIEGVVTAYKDKNFFMQVDPDDHDSALKEQFSGIYVYKSTLAVNVGDKVRVSGKVMNYYDQLQIANVENVEIIKANKGVPGFVTVDPAKVKNGGELKDAYNGVLVKVEDVNVTEAADSYHVFGVAGGLKVDDDFYSFEDPAVGTHFAEIRGVLAYTFNNSKILPRSDEDYVIDNCSTSTCDESWSECEPATGNCIAKAGFCASKAECPAVDKICDTEQHLCVDGDPCEGVTCNDEYQECSGVTGTCVAQEGKCMADSDCAASQECNTTTHECEETPSFIKNGGFENWTDGSPDYWKGTKTKDIAKSRIVQEKTTVHSGASALKLVGANAQQRFSSQSVSLASGTYSCEFYAQGTTSIGARSYALVGGEDKWGTGPTYTELSGSWKKVTYTFTLDSNTEDFQFVFYTKESMADKYVIVDDLVCKVKD